MRPIPRTVLRRVRPGRQCRAIAHDACGYCVRSGFRGPIVAYAVCITELADAIHTAHLAGHVAYGQAVLSSGATRPLDSEEMLELVAHAAQWSLREEAR